MATQQERDLLRKLIRDWVDQERAVRLIQQARWTQITETQVETPDVQARETVIETPTETLEQTTVKEEPFEFRQVLPTAPTALERETFEERQERFEEADIEARKAIEEWWALSWVPTRLKQLGETIVESWKTVVNFPWSVWNLVAWTFNLWANALDDPAGTADFLVEWAKQFAEDEIKEVQRINKEQWAWAATSYVFDQLEKFAVENPADVATLRWIAKTRTPKDVEIDAPDQITGRFEELTQDISTQKAAKLLRPTKWEADIWGLVTDWAKWLKKAISEVPADQLKRLDSFDRLWGLTSRRVWEVWNKFDSVLTKLDDNIKIVTITPDVKAMVENLQAINKWRKWTEAQTLQSQIKELATKVKNKKLSPSELKWLITLHTKNNKLFTEKGKDIKWLDSQNLRDIRKWAVQSLQKDIDASTLSKAEKSELKDLNKEYKEAISADQLIKDRWATEVSQLLQLNETWLIKRLLNVPAKAKAWVLEVTPDKAAILDTNIKRLVNQIRKETNPNIKQKTIKTINKWLRRLAAENPNQADVINTLIRNVAEAEVERQSQMSEEQRKALWLTR